ncbi:hypothetical protein D8Y20_01410 [Mariprofundus sp. EBB-1]|uniref:hypothetical protein n=1 Tax=Mariprofundus sp. EBB-1 TaxID=2650971 RepID=UPI000EF2775D|nr:hypothetical protein [Mariprofundus sp. EBB-1]RLL55586.1 hypothetical protein D8Y20_01410 [Mariprofundus sp. EBB-1]
MKLVQPEGGCIDDVFHTSYRIDQHDCIYAVGDTWQSVAEQNRVGDSCGLGTLQGKSVFEQFSDAETRMIYAKLFERVRASGQAVCFRIHCDALHLVRILETRILPLSDKHLEVGFRVVSEQERDPAVVIELCGLEKPFITMCSYCGNLKNRDGEWQPLEEEISASDLFNVRDLPSISHGICADCKENFLMQLAAYRMRA